MYGFLLRMKMEDETVKHVMIQWARNFGYNLEIDEWEKIWVTNTKLTKATNMKDVL